MTLSEMISRVRRSLPSLTVESASDDVIRGELNIGVNEVNRRCQVYRGYTEFNFVPEQQLYKLNEVCPRYQGITKNGIWWKDDSGKFKYRVAKTMRWLDSQIPNWRDAPSGIPFWYFIENSFIGFYQKPSGSQKVRIHHLMSPVPMDNGSNYPWENTSSELTSLQSLDDAIIAYAVLKLSPAIGQDNKETPAEALFAREIAKAMQQIRRRPDLMSDVDSFMRLDSNLT